MTYAFSCDLFCCCFQLSSDLLRCPAGPVSLLSGLNPRPSVLVAHFFMVAVYGIGRLLLPRPTLRGLWTGLLLWGAAGV
jgi:squalene monooxygenase